MVFDYHVRPIPNPNGCGEQYGGVWQNLLSIWLSFVHAPQVSGLDPTAYPPGLPAGAFATTHWSVVVRAGDSQSPEASSAMERLCRTYWYPLYVFVRRKGNSHEDASDLTQAFFARFLEKRYVRSVDANLGKFRTFLLTSFTHFLA